MNDDRSLRGDCRCDNYHLPEYIVLPQISASGELHIRTVIARFLQYYHHHHHHYYYLRWITTRGLLNRKFAGAERVFFFSLPREHERV